MEPEYPKDFPINPTEDEALRYLASILVDIYLSNQGKKEEADPSIPSVPTIPRKTRIRAAKQRNARKARNAKRKL